MGKKGKGSKGKGSKPSHPKPKKPPKKKKQSMVINANKQLPLTEAEMTANDQFFDAMIRHQVGLLRLAGSIRNEVIPLLDATESDVRRQINEAARKGIGYGSPAEVKRTNKLLVTLAAIRGDAWIEVAATWNEAMVQLSLSEPHFVDAILKTTMPVDLDTAFPNARRLRAIVAAKPFEGKTLRQWSKNVARADIDRMNSQIQIGLIQGESGQQIARRIVGTVKLNGTDGVFEIARRDAAGITRTATNAIANYSRQEYHKENADIIESELYVATLDFRTTQICASLDGKKFPIGEGPIPPVHFNCRSLRVALVDNEAIGNRPARRFTDKQLLREYSEEHGIDPPVTNRDKLPRGNKGKFDDFARRRKRELTGTVPAKVTYQDFLKRQSKAFQDDYLGQTKGRLFRQGVPLDRFVDPAGRPLTLSKLASTEKDAFLAAGLDPENFLQLHGSQRGFIHGDKSCLRFD